MSSRSEGKASYVKCTFVPLFLQSCSVVLVFWFWQEIVFGVTYVFSVQYSCALVSVFWWWREIVLEMRTRFYKKILLGYFLLSASRCVFFIRPTLFYSVSIYFIFLLYRTDPQVEVQIRILLNDK